jgi:hypothetical protein
MHVLGLRLGVQSLCAGTCAVFLLVRAKNCLRAAAVSTAVICSYQTVPVIFPHG